MTSVSVCLKCESPRFKFNEKTNEFEREGKIGMKSSCCGKCSNINCADYGVCTCSDRYFQQLREERENRILKGIEEQ